MVAREEQKQDFVVQFFFGELQLFERTNERVFFCIASRALNHEVHHGRTFRELAFFARSNPRQVRKNLKDASREVVFDQIHRFHHQGFIARGQRAGTKKQETNNA
jgi:hypothetical protein